LASVWRVDSFGGTRTVDVDIRRLRQKLGLRGNTYIRTVANVGYGLVDSWQFLCMPPPVGHRTTVPVSAVTRFLHGVSPLVTPWSSFRKKSRPSWENGPWAGHRPKAEDGHTPHEELIPLRSNLKEIIAFIRPDRWQATREAANEFGAEEIMH